MLPYLQLGIFLQLRIFQHSGKQTGSGIPTRRKQNNIFLFFNLFVNKNFFFLKKTFIQLHYHVQTLLSRILTIIYKMYKSINSRRNKIKSFDSHLFITKHGCERILYIFFIFLCIVQNSHCFNVLGYSDIQLKFCTLFRNYFQMIQVAMQKDAVKSRLEHFAVSSPSY